MTRWRTVSDGDDEKNFSEEDEEPKEDMAEPGEQVVVESSFACCCEYALSMCAVQAHVVTVEDVMVLQTPKKEWTDQVRVFNKLEKQLMALLAGARITPPFKQLVISCVEVTFNAKLL